MTLNFFDENSPYLNHPLLTAERTVAEVDFVVDQLGLSAETAVLDVGCGFGRHAIELARRGFVVTAVDSSRTMIDRAKQLAQSADVSVNFLQASGEALRYEAEFDGAICLFTTLGQIGQAGDNVGLLTAVYQALKPSAKLIIEVPQMETAVANFKPQDIFDNGTVCTTITRIFDAETHIWTEQFEIKTATTVNEFLLKYRLFSESELTQLMEQAGFEIVSRFGNYDGAELTADSGVMILVGQK